MWEADDDVHIQAQLARILVISDLVMFHFLPSLLRMDCRQIKIEYRPIFKERNEHIHSSLQRSLIQQEGETFAWSVVNFD